MITHPKAGGVLAALVAVAALSLPAAQVSAEQPPRRAQESNIFSDGPNDGFTTDDSDNNAKHLGCSDFLQTNHDPEDKPSINFNPDAGKADAGIAEGGSASIQAVAECIGGVAAGYSCNNIDLMSFISNTDLRSGTQGNDIWGWTHSSSGREFALMCLTCGTAFVEVTDPVNPVYVGILLTHTSCSSWRDVKTYADHAFVVSEASSHGMQVFDMTQLLTVNPVDMPVEFSNTAHYSGFGDAHNIVINEDTGYAYGVGTNTQSGGLHMVDISDPVNPTFAGGYSQDGYTHDAQCVVYSGPDSEHVGKEICFNYNEDTLTIVDVTTKSNPIQLSRTGYTGSRYTHQGWLTEDMVYAIANDEIDEGGSFNTRTHVFDVSDLDSVVYTGFNSGSTRAKDHNLYVKGDLVFMANYQAGLQVAQINDLSVPTLTEVAHFDIYTSGNNANYNGAWSNYPYFPSGTIIVSGIEQGLFVLRSPNNFGTAPTTSSPTKAPITQAPVTSSPTPAPTQAPITPPGFCSDGSATCNFGDVSTCDCSGSRRSLRGELDMSPAEKEVVPQPPSARSLQTCSVEVNFDLDAPGGSAGWSLDGSTCYTGSFSIGTPTQIMDQCTKTQLGGDHTVGAPPGQALFSLPSGADAVGGECRTTSPTWSVEEESTLSAWYYHGQGEWEDRDDYFALELSLDGGASWSAIVSYGDETVQATWKEATATIPAGSSVMLRLRTSEGTGSGIDDVSICPTGRRNLADDTSATFLRRLQCDCPSNAKRKNCPSCCIWNGSCTAPATPGPTSSPVAATPQPTPAPVTPVPTSSPISCFCSTTAVPTGVPTAPPTSNPVTDPPTPAPVAQCLTRNAACSLENDTCCPGFTCTQRNNGVVCR